jgi:hypothetical protein
MNLDKAVVPFREYLLNNRGLLDERLKEILAEVQREWIWGDHDPRYV